ncbi:unnamed protein product [Closterium sp. NIES-54]
MLLLVQLGAAYATAGSAGGSLCWSRVVGSGSERFWVVPDGLGQSWAVLGAGGAGAGGTRGNGAAGVGGVGAGGTGAGGAGFAGTVGNAQWRPFFLPQP